MKCFAVVTLFFLLPLISEELNFDESGSPGNAGGPPGEKKDAGGPPCLPNITQSEVPTRFTISGVLSLTTFFPCNSDISKALKAMFESDEEGRRLRQATSDSVKNLCPAFVNLTSTVILSGYKNRTGPNLRATICSQSLISTTVEERDFCRYSSGKDNTNTATLQLLAKYPMVAKTFQELVGMGGACQSKCGNGSKQVLCNAFYSLATLLSMSSDMKTNEGNGTQRNGLSSKGSGNGQGTSGGVATSQPLKTGSAANSLLLSPSTNHSEVIGRLAKPILSLSRDELDTLVTAGPGMLRFPLRKVKALPDDLKEELIEMKDSGVILRMFWIVKLNPDRLRNLTDREWAVILEDPAKLFTTAIWFKDRNVAREVSSFSNLVLVVKYIYWYRKNIFIDLPKAPSNSKTSLGPDTGPKGTRNDLDDLFPQLTNEGDSGSKIAPEQGGKEPPDSKPSGKDNTEKANNKNHQSNKPEVPNNIMPPIPNRETNLGNQEDDRDSGRGDEYREREHPEESMPAAVKKTVIDTHEPENLKKPWSNEIVKVKESPKKKDDSETVKEEASPVSKLRQSGDSSSSGRSYGPFHFLMLFLVVGGVVVVAYVCMHNRKKMREGVSGYMSGKSKRKRVRDYKPLASEN